MKSSGLIILLLFLLSACSPESVSDREPLHIVVTTSFIKDGVKEIVGDSAEVTALIGPATDPANYEATTEDLDLMSNADVIICNGLNLETKMADVLQNFSRQKPVLKISDGVDSKNLIQTDGVFNPNICLDLEIWMQGMEYIAVELGKIDSLSASYFMMNYKLLSDSALNVDRFISEKLDSLSQSPIVLTTAEKYAYFAKHYGLISYSLNNNFSTLIGSQSSSYDLIDFIIQSQIPFIYTDASSNSNSADSIITLCEQKSYILQKTGPLYADASGEPDTEAGTYFGMLLSNMSILVSTVSGAHE